MRIICMTALLALLVSAPARAQQRCSASAGPSQLGVQSIDCRECDVFTAEGWVQFRMEPAIGGIEHGSPADGVLRAGDVLLRVNGLEITTTAGAMAWSRPRAGEPMRLDVRRDAGVASVVLQPRALCAPHEQPARAAPARTRENVEVAGLGVGLRCGRSCSSSYTNGVLMWWRFSEPPTIATVARSGRAEGAGLLVGDRILRVAGHPIDTQAGSAAFVALLRGSPADMEIERRGTRRVIALR